MMGSVLFPTPGSGGPGEVDPALEGRVAQAETDIAGLKSGKATTASVTAVRDRLDAVFLPGIPQTRTVRKDGTGNFTSIDAALAALRAATRYPGARVVVDVGPGTYNEILGYAVDRGDEDWISIRGGYEADCVATGDTVVGQLVNTTDTFLVEVPLSTADLAGIQVGDDVWCHFGIPAGGTDAQNRMTTSAAVHLKDAAKVVLVVFGARPAVVSGLRLARPKVQIVVSDSVAFGSGRTWRANGLCIRSNVSATGRAPFTMLYLQSGAELRTVDPEVVTMPALILTRGNAGIVGEATSLIAGSVAVCGHRGNGIYTRGRIAPRYVVANGNVGDSIVAAGASSSFSYVRGGSDARSIVMGNLGAGVSTLGTATSDLEGIACKGHGFTDFFTANSARLQTIGATSSVYSPFPGQSGNSNGYNLAF